MNDSVIAFAHSLAASSLHDQVVHWLRTTPGLPPILQTVHLLSIACLMGSIVLIDLRMLGLAAPSQNVSEMIRRLMPWTWTALPLLFVTGAAFVIARPNRYATNPVFGYKFALLAPAVALAAVLHLLSKRELGYWENAPSRRATAKIMAAISLLLWLGVALAGRWIAYADYLFDE